MNWQLSAEAAVDELLESLRGAEPEVSYAGGEPEDAELRHRDVAIDAAVTMAEGLAPGGDVVLASISAHETIGESDEGFKPAHLIVTVSRVAP